MFSHYLIGSESFTFERRIFNVVKKFLRILSVATAGFGFNSKMVPGAVISVKAPNTLLNVKRVEFEKDGRDATKKIIDVITRYSLPHDVFLFKGITIAGLNFLNPFQLLNNFGRPIIIVYLKKKNKPPLSEVTTKVPHGSEIQKILGDLPEPLICRTKYGDIFFNTLNFNPEFAKGLIKKLSLVSKWPEPLRIAKLIASSYVSQPHV